MRPTKLIKYGLSLFGLFLFFLLLTFPYSRLGPKLESALERALQLSFGRQVDCTIEGFNLTLPFGFSWNAMRCEVMQNRSLFEFGTGRYQFFFTSHSLQTKIGEGQIKAHLSGGFRSPSHVELDLEMVPLAHFLPGTLLFANRINPRIPIDLKIEGFLMGQVNFPLQDLPSKNGAINLSLNNLKLPKQPLLDLISLDEIKFSKAVIKASLENGKLEVQEVEAKSPLATGKAEGFIKFEEDINKSTADLKLKWKIQESDALRSTPVGQIMINSPCPSQDTESFCTKRVTRLDSLF